MGALTGVSRATVGKTASVGSSVVGVTGMSVGGTGVAVGIADCVIAISVIASATAVFCISVTLRAGADLGPQAASAMTSTRETKNRNFLFIFSPSMDTFITKAGTA
jgi:hypothetical protein